MHIISKDHNQRQLQKLSSVIHCNFHITPPKRWDNPSIANAYSLSYQAFRKKPHFSPVRKNLATSLGVGDCKYYDEYISTTARQNLFMLSIAVDSPIYVYSSVSSVGTPYASIQNSAVIF